MAGGMKRSTNKEVETLRHVEVKRSKVQQINSEEIKHEEMKEMDRLRDE